MQKSQLVDKYRAESNYAQNDILSQGCAIFFNSGLNSNKHNTVRAAPLNNIIFYQLLILLAIKIKLQ